ncbi:class I adenylate-forming enzyme family protein [Microbacterium sp.]|uniref:class I adenylate-forming enzyme family protein n=1 Tax=Microbacterium sp. TaxID=51671 RepID=UPI002E376C36|nr:class I adenylate-forming enzyme family protein [Microbacterium sp.]HEX5728393.1 class I adenylate-forming enzyme family protein [Microbacterium sp.]
MLVGTYSGAALQQPAKPSDLLRAGLATDSTGLALVSARARLTWEQLDELSGVLAAGYLDSGLQPGDRIASLMPNRYELIVHYLACFKAGLVATPLNYRYTAPEIDHALGISEARMLLAHVEREADLAASERVAGLALGTLGYLEPEQGGAAFQELLTRNRPDAALPAPAPTAPAVIFFTSGSTGPPKGVTHTHETLGWMFATAAAGLEFGPGDLVVAGSSLSHVGAFYVSFGALSAGAGIAIARTFDGDELLPLLRDDRPTVLSMLPSALFALTRDHGATQDDFSSLRLCRAAGDKVSAELEREFTALSGFAIDEAYGLSETGLVSVSPPADIRLGSVGRAVPGLSLSIRDEAGDVVDADGEGRAWIKTGAACVGYWGDPHATDAAFTDGWFDSGDVLRADADGYLYFEGRRKQIIVHDGSNISPQEIEGVLLEHPSVDSAGVIGIHDEIHGENVRAYITLRNGSERPSDVELIRFARAKVGYKAPDEIVVLDEMPSTATGKVDRTGLKRMAERSLHRNPPD